MLRTGDNAYFTVIDFMKGKELFFLRKNLFFIMKPVHVFGVISSKRLTTYMYM